MTVYTYSRKTWKLQYTRRYFIGDRGRSELHRRWGGGRLRSRAVRAGGRSAGADGRGAGGAAAGRYKADERGAAAR
jgi:hypothetical protein